MRDTYKFISKIPSFYDLVSGFVGYRKSVRYFVSKIKISHDQTIKVLDVGCGTGPYSIAILEQFKNCEVTAFDSNADLVHHLQTRLANEKRFRSFVADTTGPLEEISGEVFDVIITAGVLEYVSIENTIKNLTKHLKIGGYFLNSPVRDTCWGRIVCKVYHCRPYPQSRLIEVFTTNNFTLTSQIKLPWFLPASFKEAHIFQKIS